MDFEFTKEQESWRQEVRDFLEKEIAEGTFTPMVDGWTQEYYPPFTKKVAAKGWIGLTWPKKYGGQERSQTDRMILTEEMLRYGAPAASHWLTDRQIGRALLAYGTEEQRQEFLPKIIDGEAYIGVGMSESESGSDLASLKTKATEDGDYYVINGRKIWTSGAGFMTHFYLVARTDPDAPRHRGISEFILDAKAPGITIRPIYNMAGVEVWGEVFYDDVRVHKKYLIGEKNRGFYQILNQLDYERAGLERLMGNYSLFSAIIKFSKETQINGKPVCQDPLIRSRLAQLEVEFEIGRLLTYRVVQVMEKGLAPNVEAAMAKAYCTTFEGRLAAVSMDILGQYGLLWKQSKYSAVSGLATISYLDSRGYGLMGGTTEVLKNIIANRGLGLPALT